MQQHSLLATKLYTPPIRSELVPRPRLIERLNAALPVRGELMGTVGASGSVTTTLLNILGGLDRPSAGANNETWRAASRWPASPLLLGSTHRAPILQLTP